MENLDFLKMAEQVEAWAGKHDRDTRANILVMGLYQAANFDVAALRAFAHGEKGTEYGYWMQPMIALYGVPEDVVQLQSAFRTLLDPNWNAPIHDKLCTAWGVWADYHLAADEGPNYDGVRDFLMRCGPNPKAKPKGP